MAKYCLSELAGKSCPGVCWGGGYDDEYAKYETEFPYVFPHANSREEEGPRYILGQDGYWYDPSAKDTGRALLCCTGDIMCEPRQHRAYKYGNSYYFHPQFKYVRSILQSADFTVGNLETTITDRTAYAGQWHRIEGKYHCNAPKCYLDAIRYAGFDALVNANNHNCDSAVSGLIDTLSALDEYGFIHTGTFRPEGDPRYVLVRVNGIRLAVLSYATYFNHLDENFTELGRERLLNAFSAKKAAADIAAAKANGAEFIISYIHWGKEYTHEVIESQKAYAKQLADAGADYIIGSHPHSLQPRGSVQANDGRIVPVVYSMGNFVTNEVKSICKHTGILQLSLRKTADGVNVAERFIPCYVFDEIHTSAYAPVPTDVTLNGGLDNALLRDADKYIRNVMAQLSVPKTAATDINSICDIIGIKRPSPPNRYASMLCRALSVKQPTKVKNRSLSRLCSAHINVTQGSLYFGIVRNSDEDLRRAYKNGAAAVVTDRYVKDVPCLVVPDINKAYCDALRALKGRFEVKTTLITGSAGKTTTKQLLELIAASKYNTLVSPDNWDTRHTGMLIMQRLREYHEFYIQEVHEGDRNSARMLSEGLCPDYAIITNIGSAHRENFTSDEEFFKCFTDITAGLKDGGTLFVNGDDAQLMSAVSALNKKHYRVVTFGIHAENPDYRAENICCSNGWLELDIVCGEKRTHLRLRTSFEGNAYSVAAAFALAMADGIDPDDIAGALAEFESSSVYRKVTEYRGLKMMLDCRSASPAAVKSTINAFCAMQPEAGGKRVAVIGDIPTCDDEAEAIHREFGRLIASTDIDCLLCYGDNAKSTYDEAVANGFEDCNALYCQTKRALEKTLYNLLEPGDTLLINGGRKMYFNSTVRKLFGYTFNI